MFDGKIFMKLVEQLLFQKLNLDENRVFLVYYP